VATAHAAAESATAVTTHAATAATAAPNERECAWRIRGWHRSKALIDRAGGGGICAKGQPERRNGGDSKSFDRHFTTNSSSRLRSLPGQRRAMARSHAYIQPKTVAEGLFPSAAVWTDKTRKGARFYCKILYQYVLLLSAALPKLDIY
jgi:hypothetical protein